MSYLLDVVNFNSDASCLSSRYWLESLSGGEQSRFMKWLGLYVSYNKKILLGIPGCTLSDIYIHNPCAIDYINAHTHIFQILQRPYSHDIAFFRTEEGFLENVHYGDKVIRYLLDNICEYYLFPEFMATNQQLRLLAKVGVSGVFLNPIRFAKDHVEMLNNAVFKVQTVRENVMDCVLVDGKLTELYLDALHSVNNTDWNQYVNLREVNAIWRDGESSFLIPDGLEREESWMEAESAEIIRLHVNEYVNTCDNHSLKNDMIKKGYPVHSFNQWMGELRMLWYTKHLDDIERGLDKLSLLQKYFWLFAIGSDILSSVEKKSPIIELRELDSSKTYSYRIKRKNKAYEGEDVLELIRDANEKSVKQYLYKSNAPHIMKLRGRVEFLSMLDGLNE